MKPTLYAIVEAALAVAMGVDHLFRAVFLCHVREATASFQDVRGRVVEEHDETGVAVITSCLKGCPQAFQLSLHQFLRVLRFLLIPASDLPAPVQVEWSLEGIALGAYQRVIPVWEVIVLNQEI